MQRRLARDGGGPLYRQRTQAECVYSLLKRNLGSELRSRISERLECEMLLRAVVHNTMLL